MFVPFYDRNGITIYCGDCLEIMPQLDLVFDAVIADLPYNSIDAKWDILIPLDDLWNNYHKLLKSNGAIILSAQDIFSAILLLSNKNEYRHKWVWEKDKCGNFNSAKAGPLKLTEDILVFSRFGFAQNANNKAVYNPQMRTSDKYQKPIVEKYRPTGLSISKIKMRPNPFPVGSADHYDGWKRYPKNILYYPVDYSKNRFHPTQKPIGLMAYLVRTYTNPNDLILDNCIGSGTTLVAAQNEGRRAVGIEISEEYCEIAVDRLRQRSFFSIPDKIEVQPEQLALLDTSPGGAK